MAAVAVKSSQPLKHLVPVYTSSIAIAGLVLLILSVLQLPEDYTGLIVFSLLVIISELGSVELFRSTRGSSVSASMAVSIAAILALGPLAGVLIQVASGLTSTAIKLYNGELRRNNASWLRVSGFNVGMFVLSTASAGQVFLLTGGRTGDLLHMSNLLPLLLAVTVDTLVNIALLVGVIHLQTGRSPWNLWRQDFQWSVPITILSGVMGGSLLALAYNQFGLIGTAIFFLPILSIGYSFRLYANDMRGLVNRLEGLNDELNQANQQLHERNKLLRETNTELLETMAAVIDAYDDYTHRHSTKVAKYAAAIAQAMRLPEADQEQIFRAALLHDIGKIGVNLEKIILKDGPLSKDEYDSIRRHPAIGAEIINRMKSFNQLVPLIRHHHEKFDGSGYPDGLAGEVIPLGARVLTLADSLEAMLSDRPYRRRREVSTAVGEVLRCSGTQFDPQVVQAFLRVLAEKGPEFFTHS